MARDTYKRALKQLDLARTPGPGRVLYVKPNGNDGNEGFSWDKAKKTFKGVVDDLKPGYSVIVGPGVYDPAEAIVIPVTAGQNLFWCPEELGSAYIEPTTAGLEGMQVLANDITLRNIGVAGESTADYALNVRGTKPGATKFGKRFRAYNCKFELGDGAGPAVLFDGSADYQASDAILKDCEFAYAAYGVRFDDSAYGYPTQIKIIGADSHMHNIATACIGHASGGGVNNLLVADTKFDAKEDGTEPTHWVKVDRAGDTGLFIGNGFSTSTLALAKFALAADIGWGPNGTEAGWSTARPA